MVARIDLWDTVIGAVAWDDQQGFARVEFTDAYYRSDWNIAPLTMPKEKRMIHRFPTLPKETFMGLPGALSDALPDRFGSQVLDAWLASKGSSIPRRQACGSGSAADRARGRQFCGVIMIKKKKSE